MPVAQLRPQSEDIEPVLVHARAAEEDHPPGCNLRTPALDFAPTSLTGLVADDDEQVDRAVRDVFDRLVGGLAPTVEERA